MAWAALLPHVEDRPWTYEVGGTGRDGSSIALTGQERTPCSEVPVIASRVKTAVQQLNPEVPQTTWSASAISASGWRR